MSDNKLEFKTKCTKVTIDYAKCEPAKKNTSNPKCGFACIKADRLYDRNILRIDNNKPVLALSADEAKNRSNESLSWEYACSVTGNNAIQIAVSFPELDVYCEKSVTKK